MAKMAEDDAVAQGPEEEKKGNWVQRLQSRWQLKNTTQVFLVLIVFACTGTTVAILKPFLFGWLGIADIQPKWLFTIIYLLLILPIYNIFLLVYGFIFGQFKFFWAFEKRMFARMTGRGRKKKPAAGAE